MARKISYQQAINEALAQEMRRDSTVFIIGEDVAGGAGAPGEEDAWGGVLGVTFSIPLRRALVVNGGLPYPEGVAAAEVLKVGSRGAEQTDSAVRENGAAAVSTWMKV